MDATGSQRVGAGVKFGNSWDFGFLYSGLNATGKEDPIAESFTPLYSLFPYTFTSFNPLIPPSSWNATATSNFSYDVIDFEAGYSLNMGRSDIRVFGGLRYANTLHNVSTY